jgi:hypothetical protein
MAGSKPFLSDLKAMLTNEAERERKAMMHKSKKTLSFLVLFGIVCATLSGCVTSPKTILGHPRRLPSVPCYGFYSTCWRPWPGECPTCPSPFAPPLCEHLDLLDSEVLPERPPAIGPPSTLPAPAVDEEEVETESESYRGPEPPLP